MANNNTQLTLVGAGLAAAVGLAYLTGLVGGSRTQDQSGRSTTSSSGGGPTAYETDRAVHEYLQFHFGAEKDLMPYPFGPMSALNFLSTIATLGKPHIKAEGGKPLRALDIGCAVGGASFEMAKWCNEVVGIDFSHAFVAAANKMLQDGEMSFELVVEGEIMEKRVAKRPDVSAGRVRFEQGDACSLSPALGQFHYVLAANLLCRLPEPLLFLRRLESLVVPGGVVVLVSPHSWLPGWTAKAKWLGGFRTSEGAAVLTEDTVAKELDPHFDRIAEQDVPFLIREHARKFQYGVSCAVVWRRK